MHTPTPLPSHTHTLRSTRKNSDKTLYYAEVDLPFLATLLRAAQPQGGVFYDLGSGVGRAVMAAGKLYKCVMDWRGEVVGRSCYAQHTCITNTTIDGPISPSRPRQPTNQQPTHNQQPISQTRWKKVVGVEYLAGLHKEAQRCLGRYKGGSPVTLVNKDFVDVSLEDADVVFLYATKYVKCACVCAHDDGEIDMCERSCAITKQQGDCVPRRQCPLRDDEPPIHPSHSLIHLHIQINQKGTPPQRCSRS